MKAETTQDLLNVANALSVASQGAVKFMSVEHAKDVWMTYLRKSGLDVPKKVNPKFLQSTFTGGIGSNPPEEMK